MIADITPATRSTPIRGVGANCECGEYVLRDLNTLAEHFQARHNVDRIDALIEARRLIKLFREMERGQQ